MRRLHLLLVAFFVCLLAASAAFAGRIVEVGQLSNGKTIVLHPTDRLVVTLAGNASTGYFWRVKTLDRRFVKFVSRIYVPSDGDPKVGAAGKYVLRFRAVAVGATPLKLAYVQSGGSGAKPAKTFRLSLVVKAPPPRI